MEREDSSIKGGFEGIGIVRGLFGIVFKEGAEEKFGCAGEDGGLWDARSRYVQGAVVFQGFESGELGEHIVGGEAWWVVVFIAGCVEVRDA